MMDVNDEVLVDDVVTAIVSYDAGADEGYDAALCEILCMLHALYALHRSAHWQVSGDNYYGDHLLFQRLYEPLDDEIDTLAERYVELCGARVVDAKRLSAKTNSLVQSFSDTYPCPFERACEAECYLLQCIDGALVQLEDAGIMTLGWEDFFGGVVSQHEEHKYLLRQRRE